MHERRMNQGKDDGQKPSHDGAHDSHGASPAMDSLDLACAALVRRRGRCSAARVISFDSTTFARESTPWVGVEPGKQGEAVADGIMKADLAITFLTVVDRRAHFDPLLDQPPVLKV